MAEASGPRLTPLSLLAAAVVVGLLLAMLVPVVADMRESGRRAQCRSNLRELAQAVRKYHDVANQLPPLATDEGYWTWIALVQPYFENAAGCEAPDFLQPAASSANRDWVEGFRCPNLCCPSRRAKVAGLVGLSGQPTDYVAVSTTAKLRWATNSNGPIVFRAKPPTRTSPVRSVTTFADVTDGQSCTAMIGEKHMLSQWLGGQFDQPALVAHDDQNSTRIASNIHTTGEGVTEEFPRGLVGDDEPDVDPLKFGGPHPRVCYFALADGSVRSIRNSTDPRTLRFLCGRNDVQTVDLQE